MILTHMPYPNRLPLMITVLNIPFVGALPHTRALVELVSPMQRVPNW
jgi:hypothetical protein